jgi:hypothetical protein
MERGDGRPRASREAVRRVKYRSTMLVCDADRKQVGKPSNSHWREKLLSSLKTPVPQTDTGGRGENPKVNERTLVKELGKMTP